MINPSLQLRLTQKLAMAPQLQQAIRLLQLNRIELRDYIQELVEANPLLDHEDDVEQADQPGKDASSDTETPESLNTESEQDYPLDDYDDQQWQPEQDQWTETTAWSDDFSERQFEDTSSSSLREHLLAQIELAHFNETDAAIAAGIVYAINDDGFLTDDIQEIRESLLPEIQVEAPARRRAL